MRKFIITGNMVADPDMKISTSGITVTKFNVANNDKKDNVLFIPCVCFKKTAENVANYCTKGSKVLVDGEFSTYEYEKDGSTRYGYEIVANRVEFLSTKADKQVDQEPQDGQPISGEPF